MKKIIFLLIVLMAVLSVSAVSAGENVTETVAADIQENISEDTLSADDNEDVVAENSSVEVEKETSKFTASNLEGYESFQSSMKFRLTANNQPLASKKVSITLNGATYSKTTDKNGEVVLSLNLKKGSYTAQCYYPGDNKTTNSTQTFKLTVNSPIKTSLKLGDKYINYRQGSKCLFYVKLMTSANKAVKNQAVTFKVSGKTYTAKTDKNGIAKIYLNLKKGSHKVTYSFAKTSPYLASSGAYTIKVKAKMAKGNGYWLWPKHMKSLNLKSLSKKGTKHLFLHADALSSYGKSSVVSFIKKAHRYGIKVHLWMQICYSGGKWVSPVNDDGSFKYGFMNKKISQAKYFAKIKGVDGVHFDYMRYGGTAHKHKNAVESINYFVKKAAIAVHKVRPNCIVSGALMPEPSAMHYYYGQDVPTLSRYVDALLPMVYKGNYHQTRGWIKSVTNTFVKQSSGAQIWTGLQSYVSDSNTKKLYPSVLFKDAEAAKNGGAMGIVLFRIGISCNFNFNKV